jgi:regulator of RNase E activity RraA
VRPGDAILADENGVLVLDPDLIETAAPEAIRMQDAEKTLFARLERGEKLPDISGATQRVLARLRTIS